MARPPKWEDEFRGGVVNGDVAALKRALELGLPVNRPIKGFGGVTALQYACVRGAKPAVVRVLLNAGADVNDSGAPAAGTPLMAAAFKGRLGLVKLLLAAGADVHARDAEGDSALSQACLDAGAAYENVIKELLAAGARPTVDDLSVACQYGSPTIIRPLVAAGADVRGVNRWGDTALHKAVDYGHRAAVEILLQAGADPNFRLPAGSRNYPGQSALDLARGQKVKKLLPLLERTA